MATLAELWTRHPAHSAAEPHAYVNSLCSAGLARNDDGSDNRLISIQSSFEPVRTLSDSVKFEPAFRICLAGSDVSTVIPNLKQNIGHPLAIFQDYGAFHSTHGEGLLALIDDVFCWRDRKPFEPT